MKRSIQIFALIVLAVPILMLHLMGTEAAAFEECKTVLQNKCATCHFVNYICPKMDSNNGTIYWTWVMHTMVQEGAVLTDEESSLLVNCLSSRDSQARAFCPQKK